MPTTYFIESVNTWCKGLIPYDTERTHLTNHEATAHAPETLRGIKLIPQGGKLSHFIPGYGSNYRRLDPNRPSWTVTATCYTDLIHPFEDRLLTVRELARLQTFPDLWHFVGPRRGGQGNRLVAHVFAQIGNAVPPLLAYSIANHIKKTIFNGQKELKTVSLFSGAGGMDIGFEASGFEIRCSVERDTYAVGTLLHNQKVGRETQQHDFLKHAVVLAEDIFDLSGERVLKESHLKKGEIDILMGGPPCQSFSLAGTREGKSDHRGMLIDEFLRLATELEPRCIVFENVPGLKTVDNGKILEYVIQRLNDLGFHVEAQLLQAADYGVPQLRKRLFLIAHKQKSPVTLPPPTHSSATEQSLSTPTLPYRTAMDAFEGLGPAQSPSSTADAIAKTIAARKKNQDTSMLQKRSMLLPSDASSAIGLSHQVLEPLCKKNESVSQYEAILLYILSSFRDEKFTPRTALERFSQLFNLRLPEKSGDAVYIMGAKPLAAKGVIKKLRNASDFIVVKNEICNNNVDAI
jgi:DNA-cytosine methyltransferase